MSGNKSRFSEPFHCLHPDAWDPVRGIRLRLLAVGDPRCAAAEDEITFLAERHAKACAGDRALVRHIGLARLLVDMDLPPVVERADGDIGLEQLEARNDVARLARDLVAAVAGRLADRIGTHAVWPAD